MRIVLDVMLGILPLGSTLFRFHLRAWAKGLAMKDKVGLMKCWLLSWNGWHRNTHDPEQYIEARN